MLRIHRGSFEKVQRLGAVKLFEIVLVNRSFVRETLRFESEQALVDHLKDTYQTHAPVRITYADGAPLEEPLLKRILENLYSR